jgi:hypothetical protein
MEHCPAFLYIFGRNYKYVTNAGPVNNLPTTGNQQITNITPGILACQRIQSLMPCFKFFSPHRKNKKINLRRYSHTNAGIDARKLVCPFIALMPRERGHSKWKSKELLKGDQDRRLFNRQKHLMHFGDFHQIQMFHCYRQRQLHSLKWRRKDRSLF